MGPAGRQVEQAGRRAQQREEAALAETVDRHDPAGSAVRLRIEALGIAAEACAQRIDLGHRLFLVHRQAGEEVVAADMADEDVAGIAHLPQQIGKHLQGTVACGDAVAVVERLEIVEVEEHQRLRARAGERLLDMLLDAAVAGQLGQRVLLARDQHLAFRGEAQQGMVAEIAGVAAVGRQDQAVGAFRGDVAIDDGFDRGVGVADREAADKALDARGGALVGQRGAVFAQLVAANILLEHGAGDRARSVGYRNDP
jgi:hypothetical protein